MASYKINKIQEGNKTFYVVADQSDSPVGQKRENRTQALTDMKDLINGVPLQVQEEVSAPTVEAPVNPKLTQTAVGMFQGNDGCWMVATIPYDPITGATGKMGLERAGLNKLEGEDRFKIAAGKLVMRPVRT